ncbi:MAG: hypothetical protein KBD27_03685 [Candidatus Moranbacteria bacterium]|nr:hypothetical protein [Candidatus Moranbacteria bacterium]
MELFLQKKIEEIRREPESVRLRYAVICASVSMVFIVGIWLLSVEDSVTAVAKDVPTVLEKGKESFGGVPSLNDLFEQAAPLRIDEKVTNGEDFFKQQVEEKNAPVTEEE